MAEAGLIESKPQSSARTLAFPPGIDARDRHVRWFLVAVAAGVDAGVVATFAVAFGLMIIATIVYAAMGNPMGAMGELQRVMALFGNRGGHLSLHDTIAVLAALAAMNTPMFIAPVIAAAFVGLRPFRHYLTAAPKFRWQMMLRSMLMMGVVLLPIFWVSTLIEPTGEPVPLLSIAHTPIGRAVFVASAFLCLIPAAAAEEVLFRGWLLRQSIAFMRIPAIAIVFNGIMFALMHGNPNLDDNFQLAMMGMAFCYMALRFGGIEFAIGAHAINNILLVLLFENLPLGATPHHPFSWITVAGAFLTPLACVGVTELALRWAPLRRFVGADQPLAPAPTVPQAAFT